MLEKFRIVKRLKMFFFVFLKAKRSFALNSQKNLVFVSFSISNHRKIVNI